jgi:secondary thiamine-phosphate synthase enzyme
LSPALAGDATGSSRSCVAVGQSDLQDLTNGIEPQRVRVGLVRTRHRAAGMPSIEHIEVGLAHVFIRHTSASITLNENASPDVRTDLEEWLRRASPDETAWFAHNDEGPDDMPAHIKAALLGSALTIPIAQGRLDLGTWQGIYLCEHRVHGGSRRLTVTAFGAAY